MRNLLIMKAAGAGVALLLLATAAPRPVTATAGILDRAAPAGSPISAGGDECLGSAGVPKPTGPQYTSPAREIPATISFHLTDIAPLNGLNYPNVTTRGSGFLDYDGDGREDLAVAHSTGGYRLFHNDDTDADGVTHFTDHAAEMGIVAEDGAYPWGTAIGDYDNDGDPDIYYSSGGFYGAMPNKLYRNDYSTTGRFTDVTNQAHVGAGDVKTWGSSWGDYDNDGWLDLFVSQTNAGPFLFHNNRDGTFTRIPMIPRGQSPDTFNVPRGMRMASWLDFDGDGYQDIFQSAYKGPMLLWHNNGHGTFTEVAHPAGVSGTLADWQVTVEDYNFDGLPDLWIPGFYGPSQLFINQADGTFRDMAADAGVNINTNTMGPQTADMNNDGLVDLLQGRGDPDSPGPDILWLNQSNPLTGALSFLDVSVESGFQEPSDSLERAHGTAVADIDNDGDTDIFQGNGGPDQRLYFEPIRFLRNDGGNANNWLKFHLTSTISPRDATGARIRVQTGYWQTHWVSGGQAFNSTNSRLVLAGLGQATQAQTVEILWPSGIVQTLTNVAANQVLTLQEPDPGSFTAPVLTAVRASPRPDGNYEYELTGLHFGPNIQIQSSWFGLRQASSLPGAELSTTSIRFYGPRITSVTTFSVQNTDGETSTTRMLVPQLLP